MKRCRELITLILLTMSLVLLFAACGSDTPKMEGFWVDPEGVGGDVKLGETTFESNILSLPGATLDPKTFEGGTNGTYEVKDNTLIVTYYEGTVAEYPMEKINGVWVIHLNKYDDKQVWVKQEDVEKYLGTTESNNDSTQADNVGNSNTDEICASIVGKNYTSYVSGFGEKHLEFNPDGTARGYVIAEDGKDWKDDNYYYEVRKLKSGDYALDLAFSKEELFTNGHYDFIITDIAGTQITGFSAPDDKDNHYQLKK